MRLVLVLVVVAVACSSKKSPPPKPEPEPAPARRASDDATAAPCIADGLGKLTHTLDFDHPCLDGRSCEPACAAADARACVAHAYALQRVQKLREADEPFGRGCQLGIAIACTNHAAAIWAGEVAGDPPCARRLFEAACAADETVGCGMVGRMMAEEATTPTQKKAAHAYFQAMCDDHGASSCRMFAFHLKKGDLGDVDPVAVRLLMIRACETGDPEACGHDSPDETFHD